jgi:hypothetical protein
MTEHENNSPVEPTSETIQPELEGEFETEKVENIVTALLKTPHLVSDVISGQKDIIKPALVLLATALVCHAVFGLAIGLFAGWPVAAMDMIKVPLVAVCALFICFPSLYVFSCVAGSPLTLSQAFGLGCSCLAMVGLLLVGLAPITWLFAVSTDSVPFIVVLTFFTWFIAILFSIRYVHKLKVNPIFQEQIGIKLWLMILTIVTLQMATCMRPMLEKPESGWWTGEKQFFLAHFVSSFDFKMRQKNLSEDDESYRQ